MGYYDPLRRANEKFLTHFMAPLFGLLFLMMIGIGVTVLTGLATVEGSRTWAWAFIAIPLLVVAWMLWLGRPRR